MSKWWCELRYFGKLNFMLWNFNSFNFKLLNTVRYCLCWKILVIIYRHFQNRTGLGLEITKTRALNRGKEVTVKLPLCLKVTVLKWHNPFLLYIWRTIILIILMSSSLTSRLAFIQVQSGKCKIIQLLYKNINHRNVFAFGCSLILLNNLVSTLDKNSI